MAPENCKRLCGHQAVARWLTGMRMLVVPEKIPAGGAAIPTTLQHRRSH
jgi:hypothetical protein